MYSLWRNLRLTAVCHPASSNTCRVVQKKGTVMQSISLAGQAVAGCSRAETFSQHSSISFAQPCTVFLGYRIKDEWIMTVFGNLKLSFPNLPRRVKIFRLNGRVRPVRYPSADYPFENLLQMIIYLICENMMIIWHPFLYLIQVFPDNIQTECHTNRWFLVIRWSFLLTTKMSYKAIVILSRQPRNEKHSHSHWTSRRPQKVPAISSLTLLFGEW